MNADMNSVETGHRIAAMALLSLLDEVTSELERLVAGGDAGWLKPLLVLHAEVYFTARRASGVDPGAFSDERRELGVLLATTPSSTGEFAHHFARSCRVSPRLRELHERVLDACRRPLERCEAA